MAAVVLIIILAFAAAWVLESSGPHQPPVEISGSGSAELAIDINTPGEAEMVLADANETVLLLVGPLDEDITYKVDRGGSDYSDADECSWDKTGERVEFEIYIVGSAENITRGTDLKETDETYFGTGVTGVFDDT